LFKGLAKAVFDGEDGFASILGSARCQVLHSSNRFLQKQRMYSILLEDFCVGHGHGHGVFPVFSGLADGQVTVL